MYVYFLDILSEIRTQCFEEENFGYSYGLLEENLA